MIFDFDERLSDSPLIEKVWHTRCHSATAFTSLAASHSELVITRYQGQTSLTVRGPEAQASTAQCPEDFEAFGIVFKLGTFMPDFPAVKLANRRDLTLPQAGSRSFWLHGASWQLPDFENADTFIDRLTSEGLLAHDPVVPAVLQNQPPDWSIRTVRRRFLTATGLTHKTIQQIERARRAVALLQSGVSILDTIYEAGYFDQPHLTRSLKYFMGQTPAQIHRLGYPADDLYLLPSESEIQSRFGS
jgi:hypothetical protein